jgi:hypothetical protein
VKGKARSIDSILQFPYSLDRQPEEKYDFPVHLQPVRTQFMFQNRHVGRDSHDGLYRRTGDKSMRLHPQVFLVVAMSVLSVLSGCTIAPQDNAAASAIDVQITILDPAVYPYGGAYRPADVAELQVKYYPAGHAANSTYEIFGTELTHNETFVCDGSALSADHSGRYTFWGTTRQVTAPAKYSCVYSRDGVTSTLEFPAMIRPTIQSPTAQATIDRTIDLPLDFLPGQAGVAQVAFNHQPVLSVAAGVTHVLIPSSTLAQAPAGPGLIIVSQTEPIISSGSGFHGVAGNEVSAAYVPVTFR